MNIKYPRDSKILHPKNTKKINKIDAENYKKTTELQLNLDELQTKVNGLNQTVDAVSQSTQNLDDALTQISTNTAGISTLSQSVTTLQTVVSTNSQNISNLQSTVGTNSQNITALQTSVGTNTNNISALQTGKQDKLTAGTNVTIDANNVISATGGSNYTAGTNVTINNGVISATDTIYTAGTGIDITNGVISATSGGGLSSVTASNVDSELATQGQVLTANGQGGATWQNASGGGGDFTTLTAQVTQNTSDIDYLKRYVVAPDPYYTGNTPSDYTSGSIFQTYDCYERTLNMSTQLNALKLPVIYFCTEVNSCANITIDVSYKLETNVANLIFKVYYNGVEISSETVLPQNVDTEYHYIKTFYDLTTNQSQRGNNIYIEVGLERNGITKTLYIKNLKGEIIAPNIEFLSKICPFDVIHIKDTYYASDCLSGYAKLAIINQNNIYNIDNLQWTNTNVEANNFIVTNNCLSFQGTYSVNQLGYFSNSKRNTFVTGLLDNSQSKEFATTVAQVDYKQSLSTSINFLCYKTDLSTMLNYFYETNNNQLTYNTALTINGLKVVCARFAFNIFNYSNVAKCYLTIDQNGLMTFHYNNTSTAARYHTAIDYCCDATLYVSNHTNDGEYDIEIYYKRFDKMLYKKYRCTYGTLSLLQSYEIGNYDKYFKMPNNDYFVVKNNQLLYFKENVQ